MAPLPTGLRSVNGGWRRYFRATPTLLPGSVACKKYNATTHPEEIDSDREVHVRNREYRHDSQRTAFVSTRSLHQVPPGTGQIRAQSLLTSQNVPDVMKYDRQPGGRSPSSDFGCVMCLLSCWLLD